MEIFLGVIAGCFVWDVIKVVGRFIINEFTGYKYLD